MRFDSKLSLLQWYKLNLLQKKNKNKTNGLLYSQEYILNTKNLPRKKQKPHISSQQTKFSHDVFNER